MCPDDYEDISKSSGSNSNVYLDLNLDDDQNSPSLRLCISRVAQESININFAFVYKEGGALYFFRGEDFYKMSKIPVQSSLKVIDGYPKKVNDVWFKASKCNSYSEKETCNNDISCIYKEDADNPEESKCLEKSYSAGATARS